MMNAEIRTIMSKDPIVANPNQSIEEVSILMMQSRIQQLPVVENGKLLGMITSYDLWKSSREGNSEDQLVKDVMTTKVVRISPKDKVGTAAELFADRRFKTLPVVNLENELKGVVTAFDVIKASFNQEYPRSILYQDVFDEH